MGRAIKTISTFFKWLVNKTPEATQLGENDVLLANVVAKINLEAARKEMRAVPLAALVQMHPLDRGPAMQKTRERVEILQKHKEEIARGGHIANEKLIEYVPSVSPIRAVAYGNRFIMFEGNGRAAALKEVFADEADMTVDVEIFTLPEDSRVFTGIDHLRKRYGLE